MMTIGPYSIRTVLLGSFRLDGGAMFGSVPKNLWEKRIPVDEENCIPLMARSLLIEGNGKTILVDVGCGDKWDEKRKQIFNIKSVPVEQLPFSVDAVTDVILTHLHFDHAGGVSDYDADGKLQLRFPKAVHYIQKSNLENAQNPGPKERASYLKENIDPLFTGDLRQLDGDTEIFEGISVHRIDGHTVGQQWIKITDGTKTIAFPTDMMPTSRHVGLPFTMGYDMCAQTVLNEKNAFLEQAVAENWIIVFEHDPDTEAATITTNERGAYCLENSFAL